MAQAANNNKHFANRLMVWAFIFAIVLSPLQIVIAEEKPEGGGEAKAEGGEGGEAKKEDPKIKEWRDEEGRLIKLRSNIEKSEREIAELVEQKKTASNQAAASDITKQIQKISKELKDNYQEYRTLWLHIRFKHPEKGNFSERKYKREEKHEYKEGESGFDARLSRVKRKAEVIYEIENRPSEVERTIAPEHREPAAEELNPDRIVLSK